MGSSLFFEVEGESEFEADADDKNDDGGKRVVDGCGVLEFFDGFDDDVNAGGKDDEGDENGGETLNFVAATLELGEFEELFADDDEKARDGVDERVDGVGGDGKRVRQQADDEIERGEEKISGDEEVAGFDDDLGAIWVHGGYFLGRIRREPTRERVLGAEVVAFTVDLVAGRAVLVERRIMRCGDFLPAACFLRSRAAS